MKTIFCRCRHCRAHRKRGLARAQIKRAQRHGRQVVRVHLTRGEYDNLPTIVLAGYLS